MTTILPEINFLTTDASALSNDLVALYEQYEGRKLALADPLYLIFLSVASVITKQNVAINDSAKQNLLYYARDEVLDHKGVEWGTPRLDSVSAKTTLRIHLSVPSETTRIIEQGRLATSSESAIFFGTTEEVIIPIGATHVDVELACTTAGTIGNNFAVGQINTLVQPLPYVSKVENITVSHGGAEIEDNDSYRERIYLAPEKLTNAGSEGAYEYFARKASALIDDVYVFMPQPGYVQISVLLQNGELPTQEILEAVYESCNAKSVRPLTDYVNAKVPDVVHYDLDVTYYLETNAVDKNVIRQKVQQAIEEFIIWQQSKIGRDINPSKLISDCIKTGAKRVVVNSPNHTVVVPGQVAQIGTKTVTFGGVEDD